jgi:hypothetical protein
MAMAFEAEQVGKRQSWANIIANIEAEATPYTSMAEKRERPKQVLQSWQAKSYPVTGHRGVVDGQDATSFDSNPRALIQCYGQKTWRKPGVSDFADEAEIVALDKGEMAEQIADALVTVKRQIEKRCLSAVDTASDNGTTIGNETRGAFVWCQNGAQGNLPVPAAFRTPTAQIYSSTLALFTETLYLGLCRSSFKQRNGAFAMHAFLGIDLKDAFTNFSKYQDTVGSKTAIRTFRQTADTKAVIITIDRLVLDTGTVDLHPVTFLQTNADDGTATANTHISGIQLDMDMVGLAYTRMPRVVKLPYLGGGQKAIVDAIFLNMVDNPLGAVVMNIAS